MDGTLLSDSVGRGYRGVRVGAREIRFINPETVLVDFRTVVEQAAAENLAKSIDSEMEQLSDVLESLSPKRIKYDLGPLNEMTRRPLSILG